MFMKLSDTLEALFSETPSPVVFWIVPPVPAAPVPVTVKVVRAPVPLRTMPFAPPLAETLVRLTVPPVSVEVHGRAGGRGHRGLADAHTRDRAAGEARRRASRRC